MEWISALERSLAPARVQRRAEALAGERPVLLMGRGKSGTRLMSWACSRLGLALGTTPRLPAGDIDHRPFRQLIKRLALRNFTVEGPEELRAEELAAFRLGVYRAWRMLRRQPEIVNGWGWKWPETYLIAPYVYAAFPHARFVHLVRDGRDVAFKRHLTDDPARPLGRALLAHLGALDEPHHVQAARSWQFQVERYLAFAERLPPEQRLELSYEQYCRDPVGTMQRIADFVGVRMTEACREYVSGLLNTEHISQYRSQDPRRIREVEAAIGETLTRLGYTLESAA